MPARRRKPANLTKGNEDDRRARIIGVSRAGLTESVPQLIRSLETETDDNRRHIARSLGLMGDTRAVPPLLALLGSSRGEILGDLALALGRLGARDAAPRLRALAKHKSQWVRSCAAGGLRLLRAP